MKGTTTKTKLKSQTNWTKVKALSESEIVHNANMDDDAPCLTDAELSRFRRVNLVASVNVKKIRNKLHMTQNEFSEYFGFSIKTLRDWEQHRREPSGAAKNLLKVIELEPKVVQKALASNN